ncbi:MAG: dUTP diphosphatase [Candidatus Cloacimonadota bacterium]|nr:dUTP diphosphatase [Candidatus Cloacimonadota bacterium]
MNYVKIKRNTDSAKLPIKKTPHSSGYDIFADIKEEIILKPGLVELIPSGFSLEIPPGFEAQIRPRSGLAIKHKIGVLNSPGTIDADYRGEVKVILINHGMKDFVITKQMRIAQIVFLQVPQIEIVETDEINETERNARGFGHTGLTD